MRTLLKRWWFWLGAVGLAVIVLAGVVAVFMIVDSTEAAFRKVKEGMTKTEVDKLVEDKALSGYAGTLPDLTRVYVYQTPPRLFGSFAPCDWMQVELNPDMNVKRVSIYKDANATDNRSLWRRIQDEYRYQTSRLGW